MTQPTSLHVAVIGAGVFGRNHLRVYRELESELHESGTPVRLSAIIDPDADAAAALSRRYAVPWFPSLPAWLAAPAQTRPAIHAASVCVPTLAHSAVALQALAAGIDLLIEKPIAPTVHDAAAIIAAAGQRGRILQVGHLERFNPAVIAAAARIHQPMFFEAHRLSIFTPRSLDVDVVLDLMIHDLDIVLSFAQAEVQEVRAVGLPVLSGKVDIANVRIEFASGCVANFTASRVSTEKVRKLRFFQPHQYVSLDYARQDLLIIDVAEPRSGQDALARDPASPGANLAIARPEVPPGEPLRLEIAAFLRSVRTRMPPVVTGEDGLRALALALEINTVIRTHAERAGLAHA